MTAVGLIVLVTATLAPVDDAAARSRRAACSAKKSTTLVANERVRVYEVGDSGVIEIYGCLYRTGRRREITYYYDCDFCDEDEPRPGLWLSGRFVAYNKWNCPPPGIGRGDACVGGITSVDVATGRDRYNAGGPAPVSDLELKPNGSFAYIFRGEVRKVDSAGPAMLDPGPGVDPASLALSGSIVYWMRDGAPQAGTLN